MVGEYDGLTHSEARHAVPFINEVPGPVVWKNFVPLIFVGPVMAGFHQ